MRAFENGSIASAKEERVNKNKLTLQINDMTINRLNILTYQQLTPYLVVWFQLK
jgi:hypothetical protein